ncbi:MAG TPA: MFS transporter [Pseudonocardiaceae bacterium]|nr:MFS transporter [Pseudonocardiaceae bacterium]
MTTERISLAHSPRALPRLRRAWMLAVLLTGEFMALLDGSIVNVAAPSIRTGLPASGGALQLIISCYTIANAVLLVTAARLGERFGPARVFRLGLGLFTVASLGCGLAPDAATLSVLRFVQGAGVALLVPQILSIIQREFAGPARARALSAYGACLTGGAVTGQVLGGVLVSADLFGLGWRPIFLLNVPVGLLALTVSRVALPRDDRSGPSRRLDLSGVAALTVTVLMVVVPLVFGQDTHWAVWCWCVLAGSVVMAVVYLVVQRRAAAPVIPAAMLRVPGVVPAVLTLFAAMAAWGAFMFVAALHLQAGLGMSPSRAGLLFLAPFLGTGVMSLLWRRLPTWSHGWLPAAGYLVTTLAYLVLAFNGDGPVFEVGLVGLGIGLGTAFSPLMTAALHRVPAEHAGDVGGLVSTVLQIGLVVGVAGFGSLYLGLLPGHGEAGALRITVLTLAAASSVAVACGVRLARVSR